MIRNVEATDGKLQKEKKERKKGKKEGGIMLRRKEEEYKSIDQGKVFVLLDRQREVRLSRNRVGSHRGKPSVNHIFFRRLVRSTTSFLRKKFFFKILSSRRVKYIFFIMFDIGRRLYLPVSIIVNRYCVTVVALDNLTVGLHRNQNRHCDRYSNCCCHRCMQPLL